MRQTLRAVVDLFRDPALRYGIKFGVAGVIAVAISLTLRLQEPTWALFTVFVLMIAQYVGAVAEKSVFRLIGTVIGGVLGFLITGALEQNPLIFLLLNGTVVAVCSAMFGQSRYPYAFLLCGLTTVVVSSNGMANPEFSWQYALWRVEEVAVGVIVAVVVQSVLWPRYARVEFLRNLRGAFGDLADVWDESFAHLSSGRGQLRETTPIGNFPKRIAAMRGLLEFGARESQHFRDRLDSFFGLTVCLARIAFALSTVREAVQEDSPLAKVLASEAEEIRSTLEAALRELGEETSSGASRAQRADAIGEAVQRYELALVKFRNDPEFSKVTAGDSFALAAFTLAVLEVRDQILEAHRILDALHAQEFRPQKFPEPLVSPWPSRFWRHTGLRAGLGVGCALFLANWLQPPGETLFVLGTWVFTTLNSASPSGRGDQRIFHATVGSIAVTALVCVALLAMTPLLASYSVMNIVLFTWLFAWGYLSFGITGVNLPMQMAMLLIVGILSLNAQVPVQFPQVVGLFFGISLAALLGAVIQRVLYPSLPQYEMRDRLVELTDLARRILAAGTPTLPLWQKTRCALIPAEVRLRTRYVTLPGFLPETCGEVDSLVDALESATGHLVAGSGPLAGELRGEVAVTALKQAMDQALGSLGRGLANPARESVADAKCLDEPLKNLTEWGGARRLSLLAAGASPSRTLGLLGAVDRYRLAALDLAKALKAAKGVASELSGDPVL